MSSAVENKARAGASQETKSLVWVLIALAAAVVTYLLPLGMNEVTTRVMAISVFVLLMWMTEAIPLAVAGLLGCWAYWVLAGIPANKVFAGFNNDSPWFILGALLLGVMADVTGLARRLAYNIVLRAGTEYSRIVVGMMVINFLLTFVIPSSVAKTALLCAICIGLIQSYGFGKGSNIGKGLILVNTFQAGVFDKTIMAGASSILSRGLIEQFGHVSVSYGLWFIAYLPIAFFTIVGSWFAALWLFPPEKKSLEGGDAYCRAELAKMGPMNAREIRALVILALAVVLWATDFLHHVSPAKIGIVAGLFACLPKVGVIRKEEFAKTNFPIVIFIGTAICMGGVMAGTDILKVLTGAVFKWMTPLLQSASVATGMILYWYSNLFHLFLADLALVTATVPPLMDFSLKNNFNPLALGMLWCFASGGKFFVYQQSALAVGYAFGYFTTKDFFKFGVFFFIAESILLLVFIPLYWPLLGLSLR